MYSAWLDLLLARTDTRVLASEWINARMKSHDTLHDTGNIFTRLDFWRTDIQQWRYDPETQSFGDPKGRSPDWLVLYESPLVTYITIPAEIVHIARTEYSLMHTVRGTHGRARSAVYDLHDAFFLPVSRFTTIPRPGPNIRIYRRWDLPPLQSQSQQDATAAPPVGSEPGEDVLYRLQATARSARSQKPEARRRGP